MYKRINAKYKIGDKVRVAGIEQLRKCVFGMNRHMEALSGQTVTIKRVEWVQSACTYKYAIEEDDRGWWWCKKCFEPNEILLDLPDFESNDIITLFA